MSLFTKIFGTSSQREVKAITPLVDKIESLEEEYKALTDQQLQAKTPEFKERLQNAPTGSSSSAASSFTRAASLR